MCVLCKALKIIDLYAFKMNKTSVSDRLGKLRTLSVVSQILLINGVFFLVCNIIANVANPTLINYFEMPANLSELVVRFYTPFTYMFTHLDFTHVFFNMICFYFMGEIFSSIVGEKRLWLQDGDEVTLKARASAAGRVSIGFGPCTGYILPAIDYPMPAKIAA